MRRLLLQCRHSKLLFLMLLLPLPPPSPCIIWLLLLQRNIRCLRGSLLSRFLLPAATVSRKSSLVIGLLFTAVSSSHFTRLLLTLFLFPLLLLLLLQAL
jgi:hypothetical protein